MVADGTVSPKYLLGITIEEIENGGDGFVISQGKIRGIDTSEYTAAGTVLYCNPTSAGKLTETEPTAPHLKLPIAFTVDNKSNGTLAVRVTAGTTIGEANDVQLTSVADNDFLVYNSTSGAWENEAIGIFKTIAVSGYRDVVADSATDTLTLVAGSNITITADYATDSITIASSGSSAGSGTTNQIAKWVSSTTLGDSSIFDDGVSVGIKTASPTKTLHVAGTALIESTATVEGSFEMGADFRPSVTTYTASSGSTTNVSSSDYIVFMDWSGGTGIGDAYLPTLYGYGSYNPVFRFLASVNVSSSSYVRIYPNASDTGTNINGNPYVELAAPRAVVTVIGISGQWYILDSR